MDADKAMYFLFEKTNTSACLCNPLHKSQMNYLTIFPNCIVVQKNYVCDLGMIWNKS